MASGTSRLEIAVADNIGSASSESQFWSSLMVEKVVRLFHKAPRCLDTEPSCAVTKSSMTMFSGVDFERLLAFIYEMPSLREIDYCKRCCNSFRASKPYHIIVAKRAVRDVN